MKTPFTKTKPMSVDSVLSTFTQAISDLKKVASENIAKATINRKEASRLNQVASFEEVEASRATTVANRIQSMLEG